MKKQTVQAFFRSISWLKVISLLIPLLLGGFLGLYQIEAAEPHVDSGQVAKIYETSWGEMLEDFFQPAEIPGDKDLFGGSYPPFYYIIARLWGQMFGRQEVVFRYLSWLVHLALIFTAWWGYKIFADEKRHMLRLWFTLMVAIAPGLIWWAQTTKYVHLLALLQTLALLLAVCHLKTKQKRYLIWLTVVLIVQVYTHYTGMIFALTTYITLGAVYLVLKTPRRLLPLVYSGLVFAVLFLPLLMIMIEGRLYFEQEKFFPYLAPGIPPYNASGLIRDFFSDYNFGASLAIEPYMTSKVPQGVGLLLQGQFKQGWAFILPFVPFMLGVLILSSALVFAAWQLKHADVVSRCSAFLAFLIPLGALLALPAFGLVTYASYFPVGTVGTLLLLATGWNYAKRKGWVIFFALALLALFGVSLMNYYAHLHFKYPRMRTVVTYVNENPEQDITRVILPLWMADYGWYEQEISALPEGIELVVAEAPLALPAETLSAEGTIVFIAGGWRDNQIALAALQGATPGLNYTLLQHWISMAQTGASIQAIDFDWQP